jgi:enediyne biosynthesis protein E4
MTRRDLLLLLAAAPAPSADAQQASGMASRGVAPQPRGKSSGLPFHGRFTDIAAKAGLREPIIYGPAGRADYVIESMGCGVAFLDYDNDGWLDIFLLSGTRRDGSAASATNRLYKNNRDGTFTDVTAKAGLTSQGWAFGVTIADYNNDGFDDIFISRWGQNVLYRNNGDGTFTDVTRAAGLLHEGTRWGTGCTWVDYNRDGFLDLFVSNYLVFDFDRVPPTGRNPDCNFRGVPVYYGPRGLQPETCQLYRNNGDGTFTDVTRSAGLDRAMPTFGLTAMAADYLGTGWPDVYVASDSTPSLLFRNQRDGSFAEQGLELGLAVNEDGKEQAGMGLGLGDFDLDGALDVFKTHFSEDTSALYRNAGRGGFDDVSMRSGLGVETRYVGWGAGIQDFDNDGLPDIFWATGSVYPEVEKVHPDYPWKTPRVLFRNLGNGKFEELGAAAGPAIGEAHSSRGVAFGDFDNDGDVDILIMNMNEPPSLLRNDVAGGGHWLKVKLLGVKSNRSAIGARVIATYGGRKQVQAVTAQSSYLSVNDPRLHFGLGASQSADLEIWWPNGARESVPSLPADRLVTIREGEGAIKVESFGAKAGTP